MANPIYGEWAISTEALPLTHADHILGAQVSLDTKGRPEFVDVQFRTADAGSPIQQIRMDWLNTLALLSFLKVIQLDSGHPFPNDPRDPNWRAGDGKP